MRYFWLTAILLGGCATAPQSSPLPIDYGSEVSLEDAEAKAHALMNGYLKDPYSAHWDCVKYVARGSLGSGRLWGDGAEDYHGWVLECLINAKNSYGAYIGPQAYQFLFRNGDLDRAAIVGLGMGATQVIFSH